MKTKVDYLVEELHKIYILSSGKKLNETLLKENNKVINEIARRAIKVAAEASK